MNLKSFFISVVIALSFLACETSVTNPEVTRNENTSFEFKGGLNIKFENGVLEFNKSVRSINQGNESYLLDFQMSLITMEALETRQASLQFDISFISEDGIFPEGNYVLTNEQIKSAFSSYELNKENGDFARFNFEGTSATLVINESNTELIKGSFILYLEQLTGERMIDGQLENVTLNSPIMLLSRFNLEY